MTKAISRNKRARKSSNHSLYWIIGGIAAAAILVLALVVLNLNTAQPPALTPKVTSGRTWGQADAPVTIEMYGDFQCPICRQADLTLRSIAPKYIDTGKAKIVFHNFAFIGQESTWAAEAAECANDQGKFWDYASYVYDHQVGENVGGFVQTNLKQFGQAVGLDANIFNACVDSNKYESLIASELAQGQALGVSATPTFVINGQFMPGLLSADQFGSIIDAAQPKS